MKKEFHINFAQKVYENLPFSISFPPQQTEVHKNFVEKSLKYYFQDYYGNYYSNKYQNEPTGNYYYYTVYEKEKLETRQQKHPNNIKS